MPQTPFMHNTLDLSAVSGYHSVRADTSVRPCMTLTKSGAAGRRRPEERLPSGEAPGAPPPDAGHPNEIRAKERTNVRVAKNSREVAS